MKDMDDKTIYVGGLPYDCTESHLHRVFELYGSIINLKIINDRNTGGKYYGFVTFKNPRSAVEAISEMNGGIIGGRVVRVNEATIRGTGGRANYGNESVRRNPRDLEWENRGREMENAYRRDRQRDSSWEHDGERERRRNFSRDRDKFRDHFQGRDQGQSRNLGEWEKEQGRVQKRSRDRDHFQGRDRGQSRDLGEWEEQGRVQKKIRSWEGERNYGLNAYRKDSQRDSFDEQNGGRERRGNYSRDRDNSRDRFQGRDQGQSRDLGEWEEEQGRVQKRSRDWEGERNDDLHAYHKDMQRDSSHEHDGERERRRNYSRGRENSRDPFQGRDRGQSRELGEWEEEQGGVQNRSRDWEGKINDDLNTYDKDMQRDSSHEHDGESERRRNYSHGRENSINQLQGRDRGQSRESGAWEEEQGGVQKRSHDLEGDRNDDLNDYHKDKQHDSSHEHDGERERRRNYYDDRDNPRDYSQGSDRGQSKELREWEEQGQVRKRSHDWEGERNDGDRQRDSSYEHDGERERRRNYSCDRDNSRDHFQGRDLDQSRDLGEWEEEGRVQKRSHDWEGEINDGLDDVQEKELDNVDDPDRMVDKNKEQHSKRQNSSSSCEQQSRDFSSESSDYEYQVEEKLDLLITRRDELQNENSEMKKRLEEKKQMTADLERRSLKLEDSLVSAKKQSSERQLQLTKLYTCFQQVKEYGERLRSLENELQDLVSSVRMEVEAGDDFDAKDLTNGRL